MSCTAPIYAGRLWNCAIALIYTTESCGSTILPLTFTSGCALSSLSASRLCCTAVFRVSCVASTVRVREQVIAPHTLFRDSAASICHLRQSGGVLFSRFRKPHVSRFRTLLSTAFGSPQQERVRLSTALHQAGRWLRIHSGLFLKRRLCKTPGLLEENKGATRPADKERVRRLHQRYFATPLDVCDRGRVALAFYPHR